MRRIKKSSSSCGGIGVACFNKMIASAMICERPRVRAGRAILSAYNGVWGAVEDIPQQLRLYLTDDLGTRDVSYGRFVQIRSSEIFSRLQEFDLFACFRLVSKDLLPRFNVQPASEFYDGLTSELILMGWDIFTGNGWSSASADGYFPIDPFTGEVLGGVPLNEFGFISGGGECIDLCLIKNERVPAWAPWNPVAVCLDISSSERAKKSGGSVARQVGASESWECFPSMQAKEAGCERDDFSLGRSVNDAEARHKLRAADSIRWSSMSNYLIVFILSTALVVGACASNHVPARTSAFVDKLRCGMAFAEVESLAGYKLSPQGQRPWGTHILHQGTTDIWLQFNDDKLQSAQVSTLDGLMKMKLWPRVEFCRRTGAE